MADPIHRRDRAATIQRQMAAELEAELRYREELLARWDKLDWQNKLELL